MPISVRLDKETEELLERTAALTHEPKSRIIKSSIKEYCSKVVSQKTQTPYERAKDLIGKEGSGRGDLSVRGEAILRERFSKKRQ